MPQDDFYPAIGKPTDNTLFDQLTTMTKAYAYDVAVKQVQELKAEKELLRSSCELALQHWGHAIMNDETEKVINAIKDALKTTRL